MKTGTVNISFQEGLLRQIDQTAREESRSRSELIRRRPGCISKGRRVGKIFSPLGKSKSDDFASTKAMWNLKLEPTESQRAINDRA